MSPETWKRKKRDIITDASTSRYYPDITTTDDVHGEQMYNNAYDNAILYNNDDDYFKALIKGIKMSKEDYQNKITKKFNPKHFNAKEIVSLATKILVIQNQNGKDNAYRR